MAKPVNGKPDLFMTCIFHIPYSLFSPATLGYHKLGDNKHSKNIYIWTFAELRLSPSWHTWLIFILQMYPATIIYAISSYCVCKVSSLSWYSQASIIDVVNGNPAFVFLKFYADGSECKGQYSELKS